MSSDFFLKLTIFARNHVTIISHIVSILAASECERLVDQYQFKIVRTSSMLQWFPTNTFIAIFVITEVPCSVSAQKSVKAFLVISSFIKIMLFSFTSTDQEEKAKMQSYRSIEQLEALAGELNTILKKNNSIIWNLCYWRDRREF